MALASETENPSLLVNVGVFTISEVPSFISTERPAKAAMALICFDEGINELIKVHMAIEGQRTRFPSTSEDVNNVPADISTLM